MKSKRFVAVLLSVLLVFSCLGPTALALELDSDHSFTLPENAYYLGVSDTSVNNHTVARFAWIDKEANELCMAIDINFQNGGKYIKSAKVQLPESWGTVENPEVVPETTGFDTLYLPDGSEEGHIDNTFKWQMVAFALPDGFKFREGQKILLSTEQQGSTGDNNQGHELNSFPFVVEGCVTSMVDYEYIGEVPEGAPAVPEEAFYDEDDSVTVADVPSVDGWEFSGWTTDDVDVTINDDGTFSMPDHDVHFVGQWKCISGTVTVNANVNEWHNEITPNEKYERTVDKYYERAVDEYYERTADEYHERTKDEYYERTADEYYERTADEYYQRTADEYYERPVKDIYQRYAQRYLVPVFTKKLEGKYNDTLVTRLKYTGEDKGATPVATYGGAFKNGHTYVTVNVAEASKGDGVRYTIADSSKNNGKKAPNDYNRPIEYEYNVKIDGDKLTVSFPDDLAYASVGAEVWDKAPKDAKNAPKHYADSVTVELPAKHQETVDLYVHIDKLGWYDLDENGNNIYVFKEWRYDNDRTEYDEDYTKIDTVYGKYALVDTKYGDYELVNTKYGDYELAKTEYGDYKLVDTEYGEYELADTKYGDFKLAKTEYGEYELADTKYGDYELVDTETETTRVEDVYGGTLTLTVDGEPAELDTEMTLDIGSHTFTLSGDGFETTTQTVDITAGENPNVIFDVGVQGEDVTLSAKKDYTDKEATLHYADKAATRHEETLAAEKHYADKEAVEHYADKEATKYYADKEATRHETTLAAEKHYADEEATTQYNESYLYRDDIKLGNENDSDGEYAVKD